jgi:hypothetical protein
MATVLMERSPARGVGERQILLRVDRAVRIGEGELRYQLQRKDDHPLPGPTSCWACSPTSRLRASSPAS